MIVKLVLAPGEYPVSSPEFKLRIWNPLTGVAVFVSRH